MQRLRILSLLLWVCTVFYVGIYLFVDGFLLVRLEVNRTSTCEDVLLPAGEQKDFCNAKPRFRRAVLLVIDALRYDFAHFDHANMAPRHHENKLPVFEETISSRPFHSRLYNFRADPPTATMQRIKGLTTGSLPTFIDVGNNFASSAVLEDNLIHQLVQLGKRVVFMGDDTWESLFPKKFHRSLPLHPLNIKDLHSVDSAILQHLYSTVVGDDWDVLIAHFLGVDHCGHHVGVDHPAMADKLTQMDGVIRSVMERLENDTLLVVMGDHGMTDTGDHGGDSQKETDAALFIYSPSPLFPGPPSKNEPKVVPQTDLVPTLALQLGLPIPYSSVGQVLLPLFTPHSQNMKGGLGGLSQLEALWINIRQINRFLETYSSMAKDLPKNSLSKLQEEFSHISTEYLATVRNGLSPSPELVISMQSYLTYVRETCQATWARFNMLKMAAGLTILLFACLLCFILSELSCVLVNESDLLKANVVAALSVGVFIAVGQLFAWGYVEVAWCLAATAIVSSLMVFWWAYQAKASTATGNGAKAQKWESWMNRFVVPPLLVLLLRDASLFSDSYVIAEGHVVTFLVFSLALYIPIHLNWEGLLLPPNQNLHKPARLLPSSALSPVTIRKESCTLLLACVGLLVGSLYLSLYFHRCWEEQDSCQPSPFLSPLSRLQYSHMKYVCYILSLASLSLWTYLLRCWLCHYGKLNSSGGAAFTARWILPLLSICLGLNWAVSAIPEESFRNISMNISMAQVTLPRTIFSFLGIGTLLLWLDPFTVFVKARAAAPSKDLSLHPPHHYQAIIGISPQTELHHLILPDRMRCSLKDVYSAPLLLFCGLLGVGLLLLHPEGMALSFLLLLLEMGAILYIHASSTTLRSLHGTHPGGFYVPWTPVVLWSLAATQFFHATGHLPTFPSIQWDAAFVGFSGGHTGIILPATMVTLNTFSSHILFAVGCPLLLFWPLVCEVHGSRRAGGEEGKASVMEMRLRENPCQFSSALLQLSARCLFIHGTQLFASACAAAILRRHLCIQKVFTPKLLFEASGFLVTSVFLLIGIALVMRVDVAVGGWSKRLILEESR